MKCSILVGSLLLALLGMSWEAVAARGYLSRACGMDIDHDGICGELADCVLCRGDVSIANPAGGNFDQFYVHCDSGNDTTGDGSSALPWRTVTKGLTASASEGDSLVVCFQGVCGDTVDGETWPLVLVAGLAGNYTITATGSQEWDFQYPTKPAVLMGWDVDDDGDYPPHDADDTAILDGTDGSASVAIRNANTSYMELAHFTGQDFTHTEDGKFMDMNSVPGANSHLFIHDLILNNINKNQLSTSNIRVFDFDHMHDDTYIAIENVNVQNHGGWVVRGSAGATVSDRSWYYRFQNITALAAGYVGGSPPLYAAVKGFKLWGYHDHVEIIDNDFDADPDNWDPGVSPQPVFVGTADCSQDYIIRNNFVRDYRSFYVAERVLENCDVRTIDNILIDRNEYEQGYSYSSNIVVELQVGLDDLDTLEDITLTNNIFNATIDWDAAVIIEVGNPVGLQVGTVTVVNNTFDGTVGAHATIVVGHPSVSEATYPIQSVVIEDNIITGLAAGDLGLCLEYLPSSYTSDYNAFDAKCAGEDCYTYAANGNCDGTTRDLSELRIYSSADAHSKECDPTFVSATDFHLQSSDTCAKDAGTDVSAITTVDYDNQTRPAGAAWDIGADEYLACHGG